MNTLRTKTTEALPRRHMPANFRVTRTRNRVFPYSWRCTVPDPTSHTGECGASSFADSEARTAMDHAAHMKAAHNPEDQ